LLILSSKHGCFPEGGRVFPILLLVLLPPGFSPAQEKTIPSGERLIVCMIQLEHADAEYLTFVLKPFLSPPILSVEKWLFQLGFAYDTSPVDSDDRTRGMPTDQQVR
jgi:hypothetical protein